MLKFVTADVGSFGIKRKQSQRACEQCRKRKKRCDHLGITGEGMRLASSPASSGRDTNTSTAPSNSELRSFTQMETLESPRILTGNHQHQFESRSFTDIQDISEGPRVSSGDALSQLEAVNSRRSEAEQQTLSTTTLGGHRGSEGQNSRFIGDLNPEGIFLAETSPGDTRTVPSDDSVGIWLAEKFKNKNVNIDSDMPQKGRTSLFYGFGPMIQKVLVPMLEEQCLSLLPPQNDSHVLISFYFDNLHPIFPVIDKDKFWDLPQNDPASILLRQGMCLAASMNFRVKPYLSLANGEGPLDFKEFGRRLFSAMRISIEIGLVTDKIHLIQAHALMAFFMDEVEGRETSSLMCGRAVQHVQSLGLHVEDEQSNNETDHTVTLFWCIWALDRLNAAYHGRPVLIHDRDLSKNFESCLKHQSPCFQLFLRVVMLLDKVIQLYRPRFDSGESDEEEDYDSTPFEQLISTCGALELSSSLLATIETLYHAIAILSCRFRPGKPPRPSSAAYLRQSLSASRITSMLKKEHRDLIVLLPFVPYAVSLSLSIAYRQMRQNKIPLYRARARVDLQNNCQVLEELGEIFWWASVMADVGKATLSQLDKAYSTVAASHQPDGRQRQMNGGANHTAPAVLERPSFMRGTENEQSNPNSQPLGGATGNVFTSQEINPWVFTDMHDVDVFEMFDANFDLDGIDAFLEGNLDLSFPTNLH